VRRLTNDTAAEPPPMPRPAIRFGPTDVPVLSRLLASSVDRAAGARLRNSTEARAVLLLRAALRLAIGGEFDDEVRTAIDRIGGITALHDVRRPPSDALSIDHLVVGPSGVFIVDSVVCSAKVSYDEEGVLIHRGHQRGRDGMVDELATETSAVAQLVWPIPVRGVIVFRDLLSLPTEVRTTGVTIKGVQLLTLPLLGAMLTRDGSIDDTATVMENLREQFETAAPSVAKELHLDQIRELAGE
jgi:hypothetical protein